MSTTAPVGMLRYAYFPWENGSVTLMTKEQYLAKRAVIRALSAGTLVRPEHCERCGRTSGVRRLHGHHHRGYAPEHRLDVIWLCGSCHNVVHQRPPGHKWTSEEISRIRRAKLASMSPEERAERMRHARSFQGPEVREAFLQKGRAVLANLTPEQRIAQARRASQARNAKLSPERRAEIAAKARAARTAYARGEPRPK